MNIARLSIDSRMGSVQRGLVDTFTCKQGNILEMIKLPLISRRVWKFTKRLASTRETTVLGIIDYV